MNWDNLFNMESKNQEKFSHLRTFNLPVNQYAIIGSGPIGIRNLRVIGDIDIIVTEKLWKTLAAEYGITKVNGTEKIVFPGGVVEAFHEGSFPADHGAPSMANRISCAEIIDGLPFDKIETVLYFKRKGTRDKDRQDVLLIEERVYFRTDRL